MPLLGLTGRRILDNLQSRLGARRLPCPPYHIADYWDRVYKDLTWADCHEWGGFDLDDLLEFRYEEMSLKDVIGASKEGTDDKGDCHEHREGGIHTTTFSRCVDVPQYSSVEEASQIFEERQSNPLLFNNSGKNNSQTPMGIVRNESILLLGCGNSKFGGQLLLKSFLGPVIHTDISSKVVQSMKQRYSKDRFDTDVVKRMEFIVDDATSGLTSLEPESVGGGVVDKGLIDALHCSLGAIMNSDGDSIKSSASSGVSYPKKSDTPNNPLMNVMKSVHRVLQPSRPFLFFSRSGPEYILRRTLDGIQNDGGGANFTAGSGRNKRRKAEWETMWKDVRVLNLVDFDMLMYQFIKSDENRSSGKNSEENFNPITYKKSTKRRKR